MIINIPLLIVLFAAACRLADRLVVVDGQAAALDAELQENNSYYFLLNRILYGVLPNTVERYRFCLDGKSVL